MSECVAVEGRTPSIYGTEMALFKLDLSGKELHEVPEEDALKEIRSLDISQNQISSLEFVRQCPNVIELNATENQIGDGLPLIGELDFLSFLNLSSNLFESLKGFPVSETLVSLNLSGNHLKTVRYLPELPLLETLDLSHNMISKLRLPAMPSLRELNLSGNLITRLALPKLPSLRVIDASQNSIETIQRFPDDWLPFVWSIDLRNNSIASADVFKSLRKLPMLYTLFIANNPVAVADGSHVAPVLVILPYVIHLDDKLVNAKDKVKACLAVEKAGGLGETADGDVEEDDDDDSEEPETAHKEQQGQEEEQEHHEEEGQQENGEEQVHEEEENVASEAVADE